MATNEKEINNYLFDQLAQLERIEKVLDESKDLEKVREAVEFERRMVERKLYQNPPLVKE